MGEKQEKPKLSDEEYEKLKQERKEKREQREKERQEKRDKLKNKERPAMQIYRPGMGKFSSQTISRSGGQNLPIVQTNLDQTQNSKRETMVKQEKNTAKQN